MKYSKEYVILNRDHWTGSDVIHVIEQGVVAMLVVMLATWLVLYPLYISCANSIDVTGDTSSSSVESDFIYKPNKWNEIKYLTFNHHIRPKKADSVTHFDKQCRPRYARSCKSFHTSCFGVKIYVLFFLQKSESI